MKPALCPLLWTSLEKNWAARGAVGLLHAALNSRKSKGFLEEVIFDWAI